MARLIICGFELGSNNSGIECTASGGVPDVLNTTVRSGVYAMQCTTMGSGTAKGMRFNFRTSVGNGPFWFRTYFRVSTAPSAANTIIQCNDTNAFTTQIASIELNNDRTLQLRDEDGTIGSVSSAIPLNDFEHYIELKIDLGGGAGAHIVEARLDGTVFATSSTRSLSAGILTFNVGANLNAEAQTTGNWFFDDMAVNDNTGSSQTSYPSTGEQFIMAVDGDSGTPQWTGSDADSIDNYLLMDEVTPDDVTTYVQSNTLNQVDNYTLVATPAAMASDDIVNCVGVGARYTVDDATGSDPDIELGLTMGGNTDVSAAIDVSSTSWRTNSPGGVLLNYQLVLYDMPGASTTGITKSDLDSAVLKLRQAATDTHFARVSKVWAYVEHKPAGAVATRKFQRASVLG